MRIVIFYLLLEKTPFKDDIRQLADLKQQISQKILYLCSTVILSYFLYLRF